MTDFNLAPAPPGFVWLYHRLTHQAEYFYDGKPMGFDAGEYRLMDVKTATWLCDHSAKRENPAAMEDPDPEIRLNAIQYAFAMPESPFFGKPLDLTGQVEYLQVGAHDMYLQRSTDGVKTTRKIIPVRGMEQGPQTPLPEQALTALSHENALRDRIAELEAKLAAQDKPIRGRRRPKSRMAHRTPAAESIPNAEAPALA